jgi:hypothetical protein
VLEADIPDAHSVKRRIAELVGSQLANQVLPRPLGDATSPPGTSPNIALDNRNNAISSLSDITTEDQLTLQNAVSQEEQFEQIFSNLLKTFDGTANGILQNLK